MKGDRPFKVLFPRDFLRKQAAGDLYGYSHPETRIINVVGCGEDYRRVAPSWYPSTPVGVIGQEVNPPAGGLYGRYAGESVEFQLDSAPCDVELYSLAHDLFSRHLGILETDKMLDHQVLIIGCGSVGSLVALELARSGVGHFLLVDGDVLSFHNVCRHQCGIADVGRFKVHALRDRILDIHPAAEVEIIAGEVHQIEKEVFDRWCNSHALLVGCADNREADLYANRISCVYGIPFISLGLWERAAAGEVFWSIPGQGACYYCLFGGREAVTLSGRATVNRRIYTTEEDLTAVRFEPGISADISFVTLIGVKLAIDLLSLSDPGFRPRVRDSLRQFTLVCNSNDSALGGELVEIFDHPLQITRSLSAERREDCPHCRLVRPAPAEAAIGAPQ